MTGNCRFLRVRGGICYFAQVRVEVYPGHAPLEVEDQLPEQVDAEIGEVNRQTAPTWVPAALEGIRATVAEAAARGTLPSGGKVALTRLVGSFVDTRDDVVRCAAILAAWEGLGLPEPSPEVVFDGQAWTVRWPVRLENPVHEITP